MKIEDPGDTEYVFRLIRSREHRLIRLAISSTDLKSTGQRRRCIRQSASNTIARRASVSQNFRRRICLGVITAAVVFPVSQVAAQGRPPVEGVWSTAFTAPNHPAWKIEDHFCAFCTSAANEQLRTLLADPANDKRPLQELAQQAAKTADQSRQSLMTDEARARLKQNNAAANDAVIRCEPPDLLTLLRAPQPIAITVRDDHVVIHHDHWNTVRRIPLGTTAVVATGAPTRLGMATARFEKSTLVVESRNLLGTISPPFSTTDGTTVVERWAPDGARLTMELTIIDPASYREPLVLYRPRVRTPDEKIFDMPPCEATSGKL